MTVFFRNTKSILKDWEMDTNAKGKRDMKRLTDKQRELVEKNIGLAKKRSFSWFKRTGIEKDDCLGIAYIGLCKAAMKWDENRGGKLSTFVYVCIDHEFGHHFRKVNASKRTAEVISLDKPLDFNDSTLNDIVGNPDSYIVENPLFIALNQVSPEEQDLIYDRYFLEKSQSEIGRKIGVTQVQVGRKEKAVKSKLKLLLAGGLSVG